MRTLEQAPFDDPFVRAFPGDGDRRNVPRQVRGVLYSLTEPTPVTDPRLVAWSDSAARLLDVERPPERGPAAELLGGNRTLPGMKVYATCYGGHQFGSWAGQLGDGRALLLGELNGWEVQLKGAGPTPYSRHADGRAVLRSSVREFLCSEIMHALGVPTTRALSLVVTGDSVVRDMYYDGNPEAETGAICSRLSPSFLRFGHFEIFAHRGETEVLNQLVDYTIERYFPGLSRAEWFAEVCRRTAELMVHWLRVGFVHGVMNTDNMSILGLTIDYGPYGWLDDYDPGFTPNTTDRGGRYAYARQGSVALWNLDRLAIALATVIPKVELQAGLEGYIRTFETGYRQMLLAKLGLTEAEDSLIDGLLELLSAVETDMTRFFRRLASPHPKLDDVYYEPLTPEYLRQRDAWLEHYLARERDLAGMNRVNPRIIPRNFLVQEVIQGDSAGIEKMLEAFLDPYEEREDNWDRLRPDWARTAPGCSALSCSS